MADQLRGKSETVPYYDEDGITIYCGDARELLPEVTPNEPHVWLMDPPYSSGGFQEAGRANGSLNWSKAGASISNDALSTRGYMNLMRDVLRHSRSATEAAIFTDWRMWTNTSDAMEYAGFTMRAMVVWAKPYGGPGRPWFNQHELIAFGMRGICPKDRDAKSGTVIQADRTRNQNHPTEKPLSLISAVLGNMAPGVVVDPFMGSGTTLRAAKDLGRRAIGIEVSEEFCNIAIERLAQGNLFDLGEAA